MENSQSQFQVENSNIDLQKIISFAGADGNQRTELESDADTLEPFDDKDEQREIDTNSASDMAYWAKQFQLSISDLKAAIALNGNSVRELKKYLSV